MSAPSDDAEFVQIAQKEARERVDRIVRALRRGAHERELDEAYRQAHTLAGFAQELDARLADAARSLAMRLRDERGERIPLRDVDELKGDVSRLEEAASRLEHHP